MDDLQQAIIYVPLVLGVLFLMHGTFLIFSKSYFLWFSTNVWRRRGVPSHEKYTAFEDRWRRAISSLAMAIILLVFVSAILFPDLIG